MNILQRIEWRLYKELKRIKLKNREVTIIANNCNAGIIYHDMKLQFMTPTINLSFDMNDYVRFLEKLPWYMEQEIVQIADDRFAYPVGLLGNDVEVRFNHYKTFSDAVSKWNERKRRINWDNLYIMGIDGDNCTYESIAKFNQLPYKHKVILTHKPYPEFESAFYLPGFEDKDGIGVAIDFKNQFWIRRYLDEFDYIGFLNDRS